MRKIITAVCMFLVTRIASGFDLELAVLPAGTTCEVAWRIEHANGSKGTYEGPYDPMRSLVFTRQVDGVESTVVYLCQGGRGPVVIRKVIAQFKNKQEASAAYDRRRSSLTREVGAPCWDPAALNDKQKALMGDAPRSDLGLFQNRLEWNARPGFNLSLTLTEPRQPNGQWTLDVSLVEVASSSRSPADSLPIRLYNESACER